jgi:hypothetical protein
MHLFTSLINLFSFFMQLIETSAPKTSASGRPIDYHLLTENPLIGHKAPLVQQFMKGKRGLATKTTSKKKKQRTADNSASAATSTMDASIIAADLIQTIQVFFRPISTFLF